MSKEAIIDSAVRAAFGRPLVNNVLRAILVEAMVDAALSSSWQWCSGDWSLCDFQHEDGTRLEVKQSAARQSWHQFGDPPSRPSFDIAARKMAWDGRKWVASSGRNAEIYVFAFHPETGALADHRDPAQWMFFVVPTVTLPNGRSATLSAIQSRGDGVSHSGLAARVEAVRHRMQSFEASVSA